MRRSPVDREALRELRVVELVDHDPGRRDVSASAGGARRSHAEDELPARSEARRVRAREISSKRSSGNSDRFATSSAKLDPANFLARRESVRHRAIVGKRLPASLRKRCDYPRKPVARVLLVSNEPVGRTMAGPGIRYRQFALELADRFEVTLVIPNEPDEELPGVQPRARAGSRLPPLRSVRRVIRRRSRTAADDRDHGAPCPARDTRGLRPL